MKIIPGMNGCIGLLLTDDRLDALNECSVKIEPAHSGKLGSARDRIDKVFCRLSRLRPQSLDTARDFKNAALFSAIERVARQKDQIERPPRPSVSL